MLEAWLRQFDELAGGELTLASGDASFRRYFRVRNAACSRIVMDAPPDREDCEPFVRISAALLEMGINAPRVLAADRQHGFLLLTDLGTIQYLDALRHDPAAAPRLYDDAIDTLLTMQRSGERYCGQLPPYDETLLRFELSLFSDWLCAKHLGLPVTGVIADDWRQCCNVLVDNALQQPVTFVHRDYHSRNLMVVDEANPGVLDFQDAVAGPYTYDLVSLLKDCYIRWPEQQRDDWMRTFHDARVSEIGEDQEQFRRHFDLMGVQRHLKAAGIFARLNHRDGKPGYMSDIPRTLNYVLEIAPRYPELGFVARLIRDQVLPGLEARPQ